MFKDQIQLISYMLDYRNFLDCQEDYSVDLLDV